MISLGDKFRTEIKKRETALAGNRTQVSRVAGENSTTEPPVLLNGFKFCKEACLYSHSVVCFRLCSAINYAGCPEGAYRV